MTNIVNQLRKEHKMTQEELASKLGVTRQTIISIENGKYVASLPLALKMSHLFDMKVEEIFQLESSDY